MPEPSDFPAAGTDGTHSPGGPPAARKVTFDGDQLAAFLAATMDPSVGCMELRIFKAEFDRSGNVMPAPRYSKTLVGWYDDPAKLIFDARRLKGVSGYVIPNPADRVGLARSDNKLRVAEKGGATSDGDIVCIRWWTIDIDPHRPKDDISATDEEKAATIARRAALLAAHPEIAASAIWGSSGNGAWIHVLLPDYPNDEIHRKFVATATAYLAAKFNDAAATIDPKCKNPSRLMCLPGTLKCKGSDRPERPWRLATIDHPAVACGPLDLARWVAEHPVPAHEENARPGGLPLGGGVDGEPAAQRGHGDGGQGTGTQTSNPHPASRPAAGPKVPRQRNAIRRAAAYLDALAGAVSGQGGHDQTFDAACALVKGFALSIGESRPLLASWNLKCVPAWSASDLEHKLADADAKPDVKPRGYLLDAGDGEVSGTGHGPGHNHGTTHSNGNGTHHGNGTYHRTPSWDEIYAGLTPPGHSPAAPDSSPPHPDSPDVAAMGGRVDQFTQAARVEDLYRDGSFLADLARLEAANVVEAEAIKAALRRIPGFRERAFDKVMGPHRAAQDGSGAGGAGGMAAQDGPVSFDLTDKGNGQRLIAKFGDRTRYCKSYGDWLIYDGRRWGRDDLYAIEAMAQQIPQQILAEIPPDPKEAERFLKWSEMSQSKDRLFAIIQTARSMAAITPRDLDRDPWLLNVRNGTINLRTGKFRPHDPRDLITKMANVSYDPRARCPAWDRFILEIMNDDADIAAYLRRAVGYSITGVIREHAFFFLYGTGRNGKTTYLNTLFNILGDYANEIDSDLLINQNNKPHPTGLTELEGRRLISADESDDGRRLAEAQVKKLSGGNPIQARRMNQDFYTFMPTHHLFFAANHKPEIRGMDPGIWRRIKLIPFEVSFDPELPNGRKPDLELESKLTAEASGILNWMLRGCQEWQAHGLCEPMAIREVVAEYRQEMDTLGWFVEDCCITGDARDFRVAMNLLYAEYIKWCERASTSPVSMRKFSSQMADKGFKSKKSNSTVFKFGLRLKSIGEREAELRESGVDEADIMADQHAGRTSGAASWDFREHGETRDGDGFDWRAGR